MTAEEKLALLFPPEEPAKDDTVVDVLTGDEPDKPEEIENEPAKVDEPVKEEPAKEEPAKEEEETYSLDEAIQETFGLSVEEVDARLARLAELEANPPKPAFDNAFQQSVYEYVQKVPDLTAEGATDLLANVFLTNVETADTKRILELNYRIANPELSEKEASVYFQEEFEAKYPDLEDLTERQQVKLAVEIRKAKEGINKFKQDNLVKPTPKVETAETKVDDAETERIVADWIKKVNTVAPKLDALTFEIEGGEPLKFAISDKKSIAKRAESDVSFFSPYRTSEGGTDAEKFLRDVAILNNFDSILKETYNHGKQQGIIEKTKEISRVVPEIETKPAAAIAPAPSSDTFLDAYNQIQAAKNKKR